jgi:hypothetical protein
MVVNQQNCIGRTWQLVGTLIPPFIPQDCVNDIVNAAMLPSEAITGAPRAGD